MDQISWSSRTYIKGGGLIVNIFLGGGKLRNFRGGDLRNFSGGGGLRFFREGAQ